jgi:hypothetical protein
LAKATYDKLPAVPAETTLSITMVESKTKGIPTAIARRADGREFFLHSRYDPLEESRFLIKDKPLRERTLYVVLGFGLGYHVKELLERIPQSSHVMVIEPDFACLSGRLLQNADKQIKTWMQNSRLHYLSHNDSGVVPIYLADRLARLRLISLEVLTHLPSALTAEGFYKTLLAVIPQIFPAAFQTHLNSLDAMLENDLRNFWANLPYSWNAAPIKSLLGKWAGRMLIIASAGPSLTDALPVLRQAKGGALLLATGTAARVLMTHQVSPDLILSVDPYEPNMAHFKGWDPAGFPLVYYHRINRGILPLCTGPKCFFVMQDEPPLPLSGPGEKSSFWQGGSVAFSALQLAHYLETNPIVFVGQDFAFPGGHTHAAGCINDRVFDARALPKDYFLVPGIDGNPVITSRIFHAYQLFMQDYLLKFARVKPGVRHINTSRTGATIQGMENLPLEQVLVNQESRAQGAPREFIASVLQQGRRVPLGTRRAALNRWTAELDRLVTQSAQLSSFERLFARFKSTSVYAQAARSYDDIYYLYETRYQSSKDSMPLVFASRFKEHLQFILEELRRIKAAG